MVQVNAVEERTDVERGGTLELRASERGLQRRHVALDDGWVVAEVGGAEEEVVGAQLATQGGQGLGEREPAERLEPEGHRPADFLLTCDCWSRHKLPAGPTPTRREPHGPVGGVPDAKEQAMSRFGWTAACALAGVVLSSR